MIVLEAIMTQSHHLVTPAFPCAKLAQTTQHAIFVKDHLELLTILSPIVSVLFKGTTLNKIYLTARNAQLAV